MSKVSVVTPVYNAAKHLLSLYSNLCEQTFADWHWVVVDDGSTDGSGKMLDDIQSEDNRVKVIHQANSGSAKFPRDRAVYESTGDFIIPIDADDSINAEYIETMVKRQQETDADIVYPVMNFIKNGELHLTIPFEHVDTTKVYTGREALLLTLPKFQIGCNGGLYKRKIWVNSSYPSYGGKTIYVYSDEVDERLYLLEAKKVVFCNAQYQYMEHAEAISKDIKPNRFDILDTDLQLLSIVKEDYGDKSEAVNLAQRKVFLGFRNAMRLYMEHYDDFADSREVIINKLRHTFSLLSVSPLTLRERLQFLWLTSFRLVFFMTSVKYRGVKGIFYNNN